MRRFFLAVLAISPFHFGGALAATLPDVEKVLQQPPQVSLSPDSSPSCTAIGVTSLDEIQAYALASNLELNARRASSFSAADSKTASYLALVPTVSVSASFARYPESYSSTAQSTKQSDGLGNTVQLFQQTYDTTSYDYSYLGASVTWNLLVPSVYTNIRQYSSLYEASLYDVEFLENSIIRQVRTSSLDVISALESVRSNNDSYATSIKILSGVQSQFDLGFLSKVELLRQMSQVSQFRIQLLNSLARFNSSLFELNRLINNNSECRVYAKDTPEVLKGYLSVVSAPQEDLIDQALLSRPDLKMLSSRLQSQFARLDGLYTAYLPQTTLTAGYNYSNTNSLNYYSNTFSSNLNSESFTNDFTISISTSLSFDGGQSLSSASALRHDIQSLELQIEDTRSRIASNISKYTSDLAFYQSQSSVLSDKLKYASQTLDAINIRFDSGYSPITDLLDAQRVYSNTQLEVIQNLNREASSIALLLFEIASRT